MRAGESSAGGTSQIHHLIGAGRVTDCSRGSDGAPCRGWIPACAGMTEAVDLGDLTRTHLRPDHSWARFELVWDAEPGEHVMISRATDVAGNTQPDEVPFNEKGYLFNQPASHPARVA